MNTATKTNRTIEGTRIERVTIEGVELLITVNTIRCNDGVMRDIAEPFVEVNDNGCIMPLALSNQHVSAQNVQDAITIALMPNPNLNL